MSLLVGKAPITSPSAGLKSWSIEVLLLSSPTNTGERNPVQTDKILYLLVFNSFKPGVPFMGHRQTE